MADEFKMSGLFSIQSDDKSGSLGFGAWGGKSQISVFRGTGGNVSSIIVDDSFRKIILYSLRDLSKSKSGTKFTITVKKWNPSISKKEPFQWLTFGKDENDIYFLEFRGENNPPVRFPLHGNKNIDLGEDNASTATRSAIHFESLVDFIQNRWFLAAYFTRNNMPVGNGSRGSNFKNNSKIQETSKPDSSSAFPSETSSNAEDELVY